MKTLFDLYWKKYDAWYERNKFAYLSELKAIKKVLPRKGKGLEIGVGTGRFASKLGIRYGVDPSPNMLALAKKRGIKTWTSKGESLPFYDNTFDYIVMIITLSFVKDPEKVIDECRRVLKNSGKVIIAIIDKDSFLGRSYRRKKGVFYRCAKFLTINEVISLLKKSGFNKFIFYQTLFKIPSKINTIEPVKQGYGKGGFVVVWAYINKKIRRNKNLIPPGFCICTDCGKISAHKADSHCRTLRCPKCGRRKLQRLP